MHTNDYQSIADNYYKKKLASDYSELIYEHRCVLDPLYFNVYE